jgi:hypothetical protein
LLSLALAASLLTWGADRAQGQEMEPRSYSAAPIDANLLIGSYQFTKGDVSPDPSLPITNVEAAINSAVLAYSRTFNLFGHTASAAILVPTLRGDISGDVGQTSRQVTREGLGDVAFRFSQNLIGSPALTRAEFALRAPEPTLGVSLAVVTPTGAYDSRYLINVSSHRWAFRPEIGGSLPVGNWFAEGSAGVWTFTANNDFFGGHVRTQEPLWTVQAHAGYNFGPNFWASLDLNRYGGGRAAIDGVPGNNYQSVTRYGVSASAPLGHGYSAKAFWGSWLMAHNGGSYQTVGLTLQYLWFDR